MAFDRELWDDRFSSSSVPFTCPNCGKGALQLDKKHFWQVEPQHSVEAHGHEDWDHERRLTPLGIENACFINFDGDVRDDDAIPTRIIHARHARKSKIAVQEYRSWYVSCSTHKKRRFALVTPQHQSQARSAR